MPAMKPGHGVRHAVDFQLPRVSAAGEAGHLRHRSGDGEDDRLAREGQGKQLVAGPDLRPVHVDVPHLHPGQGYRRPEVVPAGCEAR